ncbi:MAG: hypothetical protein M0R80_12670, partial [Proteobacteria bacterium]|nr:hypothetical protein [Pseudomonadota bacterium]
MARREDGDDGKDAPTGKPKGGRGEVVKVLVLALVSFLAGFALVLVFLRQPSDTAEDEPQPAAAAAPAATQAAEQPAPLAPPPATGGYGPQDAGPAPAAAGAASEGDAPPEVPPGKTPDGMALDGEAFYLKCWDDAGVERKGADCDRLEVFEKRFSTRLYVVDKCRIEAASASAEGKLSVASEVDFQASRVSFWNAPSTDLPNAAQIGSCLRGALAGLPIQGIEHKHARYRIFFTIQFGKGAVKKVAQEAKPADAKPTDAPAAGKGKLVTVTKDKVRVRKTPVDGEIIGKIGQGNQVRLLKQKEGW